MKDWFLEYFINNTYNSVTEGQTAQLKIQQTYHKGSAQMTNTQVNYINK